MGFFSKIKDAQYGNTGNYFEEGVYRVRLVKVFVKDSARNPGTTNFIAECEVLESSNDNIKVGQIRSWSPSFSKQPTMGNVRQFIAVATGSDIEEVGEDEADLAVGPDNPLAGIELNLRCVIQTTTAGNPFTKHIWEEA